MNTWTYKSATEKSTGYEADILDLSLWDRESFLAESPESQAEIVDSIFEVYRGRNIFPITYFNHAGALREVRKCIERPVSFSGEVLNPSLNQGGALCRFLFPNLARVDCKGVENNSPYDKFMDDHKLKRAVDFCLRYKNSTAPAMPSGIKDGLEMLGGNVATNFKPMNAKALFEKYCPEGGTIYDFAAGFGGRMLGALSSKQDFKYVAVEPCSDTFENLHKLGALIEEETGRDNIFEVHKLGSEDFRPEQGGWASFSFSSPPYFSLEGYSSEETQCYIKFPTLSEWFEGYVRPTIKNIYHALEDGAHYAVNIADFNMGSTRVEFVDRWREISEEEGFEFVELISMKLQARRGAGHDVINKKAKQEGILVFNKNEMLK